MHLQISARNRRQKHAPCVASGFIPQCHAITLDAARPESVARRRKTHQRTARENIEDICDPGKFVEYGPLVIAAQRRRRTIEDMTITVRGHEILFKIDYYAHDLLFGSDDPADPSVTQRVLTVLLAEEY